jgi:23S rRNA (adenine2030-N6)-methyltransferase
MFAYRHAFHAGNHADVMKHLTLIATLELMQHKDNPLLCIDTHAGAGLYALQSALVRDKAEWPSGIGKLWGLSEAEMPELVARYIRAIKPFNRGGKLSHYPGSPLLIQEMLRPEDRLRAFEMHPSDIGPLQNSLKGLPRQIKAERKDGFQQLRALLPPPSRRGLILMDPPYEMRDDYRHVIGALREGLHRFATGVYLLWYPKIGRFQVDRLLRQVGGLGLQEVLHATLTVRGPLKDGLGLQGSGMVVINPPFGLQEQLTESFAYLAKVLGQDGRAGFKVLLGESPAAIKTALGIQSPSTVVSPITKL